MSVAPNPDAEDSSNSITVESQTLLTLQANAEAFRLLVDSVKDYAIFLLDPKGYVISWNAGAERIKGYSSEEIIGKHFSSFYTEDAVKRQHPQHELEIAAKEGRYEEEGWRVRKDGSTFWANVVITALYDDHGQVRGFAKVTRDMTERKRAEEELRAARDTLELRVQERTAELTRANQILQGEVERRQQLEDALRHQTLRLKQEADHKDNFLAMLAHELRNPMGALSNALHVLLLGSPESPAFQRAKDVAVRQMAHQTRLVDDLLDVSRILRGKVELDFQTLDLLSVIRDAVEDHRSSFEAAGIALTADLPQGSLEITGDPTRLTQIFTNLLDNARKFTPSGGRADVRVTAEPGANRVSVTIEDSGIGIEPQMQERLFEPFAQADRSLDRSRGGLGLGLALVKGLVQMHGGTVSVRSAMDEGTQFTVDLPLGAHTGAGASRLQRMSRAVSGRMRVLVIEDNRDAAETLKDLLEIFGYEVELAFDGHEGVKKALKSEPEVVLCDIGLPGIDGYSVAAGLRQNPATALTPLVAVTGYGKEEDRRRAHDAGFRAHLTKPINPGELQQVLDQIKSEVGIQ